MAVNVIDYPVDHYYEGRTQGRVRLLALHTSEGDGTVQSLGNFMRGAGVSYHAGGDDTGTVAQYVDYSNAAWHLLNANPIADGFVMVGWAEWTTEEWFQRPALLEAAAAWLAERATARNLPLVKLTPDDVAAAVADGNHPGGVLGHVDYTRGVEGSHTDPGDGFPYGAVIARALDLQGGGDVNEEQDGMLRACYQQFAGSHELGAYDGWPAREDTSGDAKTLVDYVRAIHHELLKRIDGDTVLGHAAASAQRLDTLEADMAAVKDQLNRGGNGE